MNNHEDSPDLYLKKNELINKLISQEMRGNVQINFPDK